MKKIETTKDKQMSEETKKKLLVSGTIMTQPIHKKEKRRRFRNKSIIAVSITGATALLYKFTRNR